MSVETRAIAIEEDDAEKVFVLVQILFVLNFLGFPVMVPRITNIERESNFLN